MTKFYVSPGYAIPFKKFKNGSKSIDREQLKKFWIDIGERDKRGCYVFALKVGPGFTPYYVGKAAKQSFQAECFTAHKLAYHYNDVLLGKKGIPYLFLVVQRKTKGKWSLSAIDEVEEHLIAYAAAKNPGGITNKKRLPYQGWSIEGVIESDPGKPSNRAVKFSNMMGID